MRGRCYSRHRRRCWHAAPQAGREPRQGVRLSRALAAACRLPPGRRSCGPAHAASPVPGAPPTARRSARAALARASRRVVTCWRQLHRTGAGSRRPCRDCPRRSPGRCQRARAAPGSAARRERRARRT
ncbi:MAG: hypothetical protein MZW92_21110 [Comamonadaceae bacterium]|nr:hypothetical protein [Comamonadaceae bacterium]